MNSRTHAIVACSTVTSIAIINFSDPTILGVEVIPILTIPTAILGGLKADFEVGSERGKLEHPILSKAFTHRGFTHTAFVVAIMFFICYSLTMEGNVTIPISIVSSLMLGFILGYATHLFIDLFNGKGIPIFWPIMRKRVHIMKITTEYKNKKGESVGKLQENGFLIVYLLLLVSHTILTLTGNTL